MGDRGHWEETTLVVERRTGTRSIATAIGRRCAWSAVHPCVASDDRVGGRRRSDDLDTAVDVAMPLTMNDSGACERVPRGQYAIKNILSGSRPPTRLRGANRLGECSGHRNRPLHRPPPLEYRRADVQPTSPATSTLDVIGLADKPRPNLRGRRLPPGAMSRLNAVGSRTCETSEQYGRAPSSARPVRRQTIRRHQGRLRRTC